MEWINVKDRLPDCKNNNTYDCLVYSKLGIDYSFYNKEFNEFLTEECTTIGGVTHWMPLPEPPK